MPNWNIIDLHKLFKRLNPIMNELILPTILILRDISSAVKLLYIAGEFLIGLYT